MHKAVDDALKCTHPGRRWKRKYKRAKRAIIMSHKESRYDRTGSETGFTEDSGVC